MENPTKFFEDSEINVNLQHYNFTQLHYGKLIFKFNELNKVHRMQGTAVIILVQETSNKSY